MDVSAPLWVGRWSGRWFRSSVAPPQEWFAAAGCVYCIQITPLNHPCRGLEPAAGLGALFLKQATSHPFLWPLCVADWTYQQISAFKVSCAVGIRGVGCIAGISLAELAPALHCTQCDGLSAPRWQPYCSIYLPDAIPNLGSCKDWRGGPAHSIPNEGLAPRVPSGHGG